MDKRIVIIACEVGPEIRIRELKAERAKIEKLPAPEKTVTFESWQKEKEGILQAEMMQIPKNIVSTASNNIASIYSDEGLVEETYRIFGKEMAKLIGPFVMLQYLPSLRKILEDAIYGRSLSNYQNRFADVDRDILEAKKKIRKPFSRDLINRETLVEINGTKDFRFPAERCPMDHGAYFDSWATEILKSKPIFFSPIDRYIERCVEIYDTVYLAEFRREQEIEQERISKIPPPPTGSPPGPLF